MTCDFARYGGKNFNPRPAYRAKASHRNVMQGLGNGGVFREPPFTNVDSCFENASDRHKSLPTDELLNSRSGRGFAGRCTFATGI